MSVSYDAIVIGTGQAGPPLANRMTAAGMRVAVIERHLFGGTCVNTGCIPTKTMVASAYAARMAQRAGEYGVKVDGVSVDLAAVLARKDSVAGKSQAGVESWLRGMPNCTVYEGHARFTAPLTVQVGDEELTAARIFINTGGRAEIPAIGGAADVPYLTNSSMMRLETLPRHLVIIGGGYVGLEFGQMFRRFGSEVTILTRGARVLSREDSDVSEAVAGILEREGVRILCQAVCRHVSRDGEDIVADASIAGRDEMIRGSHLLYAAGRRPNTDDLGLVAAGIETDRGGYIRVDDQLRTTANGVWALGDCNGQGAFTHTSYNDYEIVAANLLDNDPRRVGDRIPAYAVYTDPPLGRAGMTETEVRKSGRNALVATRPMTRVGRAVEKGETQGFMKILVDGENGEILGASLLGTGCDEVIHSILDVMYARKPYSVIERAMHIHPTVSELVPTMLADLEPLN